jgi:hypothetical protein
MSFQWQFGDNQLKNKVERRFTRPNTPKTLANMKILLYHTGVTSGGLFDKAGLACKI